jgi:hypothetical protein
MTTNTIQKIKNPTFTLRGREYAFDGTRDGLVEAAIEAGAEFGDRLVVARWDRILKVVEDDERGIWAR